MHCRFEHIRSFFLQSPIDHKSIGEFLQVRSTLPQSNLISIETPESAFQKRLVPEIEAIVGNATYAVKIAFQMEIVLLSTPGMISITQGKTCVLHHDFPYSL